MKTTLEIPSDVFRKIKTTVALQGLTLKKFFTDAVQEKLAKETYSPDLLWMKFFGTFKREKKEIRRIQKIIDREFAQINPDDWK